MKRYMIAAALMALATLATAQETDVQDKWTKWGPTQQSNGAGFIVRAGYTLGGTAPIPIPAEIRGINSFSPKGGATIGLDAYKMFNRRWGLSAGWRFFYEGFHTSANVKNYQMSLTMDGNTMAGYFTGCDVTTTSMWGMTIPVLVTFRAAPRWNISVGPYFSTYFKQTFDGGVYDNPDGVGYLRVDTPTGDKVDLSRNPGETGYKATYDFKDHMRQWNGGVELTVDWKALQHMNVFATLDWGVSNIFEPDFEAIAFKMYPIYATIGLAYRY